MRTAWLAVLFVVLGYATLASAQTDRQISVSLQTGPIFATGRWMPLQLTFRNNSAADVDGSIETEMETPAGKYALNRRVFVPGNSRVQIDMLATFQAPEAPRGKNDKTPPVATFFWKGANNADLAREPVYAIADSGAVGRSDVGLGLSSVIIAQVTAVNGEDDVFDSVDLPGILQSGTNYPITNTSLSPESVMRRDIALDPCRLVVLDQSAISQLDAAQQGALLDHVRGGATLLVAAADSGVAGTWVGPMLPMDLIGNREVAAITSTQFGEIKARKVVRQHLAIARPNAKVVASNGESTIAAYTELGFGRVAMVAFPINALDHESAVTTSLWCELVGVNRAAFHDPQALGDAAATTPGQPDTTLVGALPSMVGAAAPPWRTAAILAGAYTSIVVLVLLFSGAKRRPAAMVGCVGAGVLLAGGILGMNSIKSVDAPLTLARLSIVDQTEGAMRRQDVVTFYGQNRADINFKLAANELPRALLAAGATPPRVSMFPFEVKDASASTGSYASVWQIRSQEASPGSGETSVTFGPDGASITLENGRSGALESPRLLMGGSVFSLPNIASGKQTVVIGQRNPQGVWTGAAGVIADEKSKLRTDLLERVETRRDPVMGLVRRSVERKIIGFASDDKGSLELGESVITRSETLVRDDVSIRPTPTGTAVRIDPGFSNLRREIAPSLPYRAEGEVWNEASQGGPWMFAIAPPSEMGKFDPKQLTLDIDCRGTGFDIRIQKGQCQAGRVRENAQGEMLVESLNRNGPTKVTVDLTPSDYDANGWVWLRLSSEIAVVGPSMLGIGEQAPPSNWRLLRFDPTLSGTVTGPPQSVLTTWPVAPPPTEKLTPKPAPKPQPKKDEKKPEPKKAEPKKPAPKATDPKTPAAAKPETKPK